MPHEVHRQLHICANVSLYDYEILVYGMVTRT